MDFRVPQFKIPIPMAILVKAASTPNDLAYAKVLLYAFKGSVLADGISYSIRPRDLH
jgi:hypothetical protein